MKRALFVAVIAGSLSAGASAEVVTFTGIPYDVSPTSMTTYVENGVTVTSLDGNFWAYPNPGELTLRSRRLRQQDVRLHLCGRSVRLPQLRHHVR